MSKEQAICDSIIEQTSLNWREEIEGALLHRLGAVMGDFS